MLTMDISEQLFHSAKDLIDYIGKGYCKPDSAPVHVVILAETNTALTGGFTHATALQNLTNHLVQKL